MKSKAPIAWVTRFAEPPGAGDGSYVGGIVFNSEINCGDGEALLAHFLINKELGKQWYKRETKEFQSAEKNLRPWSTSLSEEARAAIAALVIRDNIVHESGHAIFGLGHPEAIEDNGNGVIKLDRTAARYGDRPILSGLFTGSLGTSLLHIHSSQSVPIMNSEHSATLLQRASLKLRGQPVSWGYSQNEQASIIEAYRYGGMTRRRNSAEMLAAQLTPAFR